MPDPGPGLSRPCPSCGRRVPRTVTTCRCGADVPGADGESAVEETPRSAKVSLANLAVAALLLAATVVAGYWSLSQPPAELTAAASRPRATGTATPASAEMTPPNSPERRAIADGSPAADGPPRANPAVPVSALESKDPLEDVVSRVMPAVVLVESSSGRGSGFFVRPDTIITNVHVVKDDGFVKLRFVDGTTVSARVELKSPAFDIAILKVTAPAANQVVIPLGTAETLRPGQEVFTIGSPFGTLQNSVTRGIVSGLRRSGVATMVQNDAAAHPGSSGGPLLDRHGVAVGITTMGDRDKPGINYAVAIDHARPVLDGRPIDSTAPPLALDEVTALDPARPESQRLPDPGERAFAAAIADLARTADAFDVEWLKFRPSCITSSLPKSSGREWFVMLSSRPITASQVREGSCATFVTGFQGDVNRLSVAMRSALDSARRAGVLPGTVRDALRSNRLEFDGWDR